MGSYLAVGADASGGRGGAQRGLRPVKPGRRFRDGREYGKSLA
jgi:hypothetical protein